MTRRTKSSLRRRGGPRMVQAVVALVVIGAVAVLAIAMYASTPQARFADATQQLLDDLQFARAASMAGERNPHVMVFDVDAGAYHVATADRADQPVLRRDGSTCRVKFPTGRGADLRLRVASMGGDDRIGFGGYGQLDQGVDATVALALEDQMVEIRIASRTGEARLEMPAR